MNVKKALDVLMGRLGNRTAPGLRASALNEMQLAQETVLEGGATLPWFIITENAETVTIPQERRIGLPPDFIREVDEKPLLLKLTDLDDQKLYKRPFDELLKEYGDEAEGPPEAYALRGNYIMLFPKPDAEHTIKFPGYYAKQEAPLDSESSENPWFKWASDILIAEAGLVIASQYLKDPDLVGVFDGMLARAKDRLFRMEIAREEANRSREMDDD